MISIRHATILDRDLIASWQVAMALESEQLTLDPTTVKSGVEHVLKHPDIGFYLIADHNDESSACCLVLNEWSDWRNGNVLWIHSVYVLPNKRRHKLFSALYEHIKADVEAESSLRGIRLYVDKSNARAIQTYQKIGMTSDHYELFEWMKTF